MITYNTRLDFYLALKLSYYENNFLQFKKVSVALVLLDVPPNCKLAQTALVIFTVTEPLVALSPWTFTNETSGGLYGVTNLTFTMNMRQHIRARR